MFHGLPQPYVCQSRQPHEMLNQSKLDSQDAEYQGTGQATRAGPTKTPPPTNHLRHGKRKEWGHAVEPKILPHVPHAPLSVPVDGRLQ